MIVWIALAAILLAVLIGSYAAYRKTFYHKHSGDEDIYRLPKHTDRDVAARTRDLIAVLDARAPLLFNHIANPLGSKIAARNDFAINPKAALPNRSFPTVKLLRLRACVFLAA